MDLIDLRFPRFFIRTEKSAFGGLPVGDNADITGPDAKHITSVLRMKAGEHLILCDNGGYDYPAVIIEACGNRVVCKILHKRANDAEPKLRIRLFQCVPKSDKLDFIIQKATELGASEIIPVISKRCVSRPKDNTKISRLQKIAEAAAKQSGRGKIPFIHGFTDFDNAIKLHNTDNPGIIFYENGGARINDIIADAGDFAAVDVFIGSEGGFEAAEIKAAKLAGLYPTTLGKLILRAETAPVAALAILMNLTLDINQ